MVQLLPVRAFVSAFATMTNREPAPAPLPPAAAATAPVMVSSDCAVTVRPAAVTVVWLNSFAVVLLLKMMLAPLPPAALMPPARDAAPASTYWRFCACTRTSAPWASMLPPSALCTMF